MVDLLLLQHSARVEPGLASDYYKRVHLLGGSFDHLNYASLPHPSRKFFTLSRSILILWFDSKSRIRCTILHFVTLFHMILCLQPHSFRLYARWWDLNCTFSHSTCTLSHCVSALCHYYVYTVHSRYELCLVCYIQYMDRESIWSITLHTSIMVNTVYT